MESIPHIGRYMSICPFTIAKERHLIEAHLLMRAHDIRHLPVLDGERLAGLISERDLHLVEALNKLNPEELSVADVMKTDVYAVPPSTPVDEVVHEMAKHKYGSVVVVEGARVVGVFTTTDALEVLAQVLDKPRP